MGALDDLRARVKLLEDWSSGLERCVACGALLTQPKLEVQGAGYYCGGCKPPYDTILYEGGYGGGPYTLPPPRYYQRNRVDFIEVSKEGVPIEKHTDIGSS